MDAATEAELLRRCRLGDAEAWDTLFDHHYKSAGRFVFQLSLNLNPEDVEEVCQEAFLSVIRNLNGFHGQSRFQTWLFRVAANKARDFVQRKSAARRGGGKPHLPIDSQDTLHVDPPSPAPAPDAVLLLAEDAQAVSSALEGLDPESREIIELRYFADLSYDEIARVMGLTTGTVSSRLSRSLRRLHDIIEKPNYGHALKSCLA